MRLILDHSKGVLRQWFVESGTEVAFEVFGKGGDGYRSDDGVLSFARVAAYFVRVGQYDATAGERDV